MKLKDMIQKFNIKIYNKTYSNKIYCNKNNI